MSRKTKRPLAINAPVTPAPISDRTWLSPAALTLAVLVFYWEPLTSAKVSILWDAADYYWLVQKYFSDELWKGQLPYWTPFVWAGFPFLADPQVGAWYPLNWPFFLSGVLPWTIHAENFLHSLLAALGAYYLSFHLLRSVPSALLTGICYGLSGYFIGHSSHTTMVQAAAWLPWLILCYLLLDVTRRWFYFFLATLLSGLIIVVGHFQTTLYCFLALGLAAISRLVEQPKDWVRKLLVVFLIPTGGTLLSAVHTLPGLELAVHSVRSTLSAIERTEGFIVPQSLLSLLYADYYGVIRENYRGPTDITQYYFYAGGLLVPLAILGIKDSRLRWLGLLLTLVPLWYAAGHAGGLYQLIARLPAFQSVRAPVNIWFVIALGLALLAGAGFTILRAKQPTPWLPAALLLVCFADIFYWNSLNNPMAYARASYDDLYGNSERLFQGTIGANQPPLTRFNAPDRLAAFGSLSHPLNTRTEVAYGYGPLMLRSYGQYLEAMSRNPKLMNGLNISRYLTESNGQAVLQSNNEVLPRATFPMRLLRAVDLEESRRLLESLDPAQSVIVPASLPELQPDPEARLDIVEYSGSRYRIRYRASSDSLMRVSSVWFPGWEAHIGQEELPVLRVDHTLIGVVVPTGERELELRYRSTYFSLGLATSVISLALCIAGLVRFRKDRSS